MDGNKGLSIRGEQNNRPVGYCVVEADYATATTTTTAAAVDAAAAVRIDRFSFCTLMMMM